MFTSVLHFRLSAWVAEHKLIPDEQAGFRSGYSCNDQFFCLNTCIQQALSSGGGKLYVVFIDFKSAFPSVHHVILWRTLLSYGVSQEFVDLLKAFYTDSRASVRTQCGLTSEFPVRCGVRQGCILSPLLFSLIINRLVGYLDNLLQVASVLVENY